MKLIGIAVSLFVLGSAAAHAQTPKTEELLLGDWTCASDSNGAVITGPFTYLAGGKSKMQTTIAISSASVEMSGTGNATWKFLADGKLEETITDFKVASAKSAGQPAPVEPMQEMVDTMVLNQTVTSTVAVDAKKLVLTDNTGTTTTCTR